MYTYGVDFGIGSALAIHFVFLGYRMHVNLGIKLIFVFGAAHRQRYSYILYVKRHKSVYTYLMQTDTPMILFGLQLKRNYISSICGCRHLHLTLNRI